MVWFIFLLFVFHFILQEGGVSSNFCLEFGSNGIIFFSYVSLSCKENSDLQAYLGNVDIFGGVVHCLNYDQYRYDRPKMKIKYRE